MNMSKGDIIESVADKCGCTKKLAGEVVQCVLDTVTGTLAGGGTVTLTGFGTFKVNDRAARTGVNPQNPTQKIQIPATKVPSFKAGKGLKDAVKKS